MANTRMAMYLFCLKFSLLWLFSEIRITFKKKVLSFDWGYFSAMFSNAASITGAGAGFQGLVLLFVVFLSKGLRFTSL